ncbi:hypothetical protein C8T65DRAFT_268898 [Cerioporus squamosus]|nr:hypothetical protein C8T65DRAFT_268898 [Cerioporus squamosus]
MSSHTILVSVMPFCDMTTISAIMKTCRTLHSDGIPYLLAHGAVIKDERDVASFLAFGRLGGGRRLTYLKELTLTAYAIAHPVATALSLFLSQFARILAVETLRIDHAEALLGCGRPPLYKALAKLRSVLTLELSDIGEIGAKFLRALESKLEDARLNIITRPPDDEGKAEDLNGIKLLQGSQGTLQRLSGNGFELATEWEHPTYRQVYPKVEQLILDNNDPPVTIVYAHSFPNARRFHYDTSDEAMQMIGPTYEVHLQLRNLNIIQQLELRSPWRYLEACHASLWDLFLLGLQCHVRELHVKGNFMQPSHLRTVMEDTTPEYLCLRDYDVDIFTKGLVNSMKKPYAQQLRSLEIVLAVGGVLGPDAVDMPCVVETMLDMLRPLKIRSFGLFIICALAPEPRPRNWLDLPLCPAEQYLADLDMDAFARRIKDTTSTLQTVIVTMRMHRTRADTTATLGADVEYGPDAVEAIPLHSASLYERLPPLYPETGRGL